MDTPQLTPDEIERMRAIVQQHDQQNGTKGIKEFDLNNPPKEPYRHQEFPKIVYEHTARKHKVVRNQQQLKQALEDGFEIEPYPAEVRAPELEPGAAAEAAAIDARLRKSGRNRPAVQD